MKACVVLHNIVGDRDGFEVESTLSISGFEDLALGETQTNHATMSARNVRDVLKEYFISEVGSVSWQFSKI